MIIFKCDKCSSEISDLKEAVNIQYAEKKVLSDNKGNLINSWVEVKKLLCGGCKEEVIKLWEV